MTAMAAMIRSAPIPMTIHTHSGISSADDGGPPPTTPNRKKERECHRRKGEKERVPCEGEAPLGDGVEGGGGVEGELLLLVDDEGDG